MTLLRTIVRCLVSVLVYGALQKWILSGHQGCQQAGHESRFIMVEAGEDWPNFLGPTGNGRVIAGVW